MVNVLLEKGSFDKPDIYKALEDVGVMIGADICFWDTTVDSLKRLICRALREGAQLVVIADP